MKVWIVATRDHRYGGRPLQIGDQYQASRRDARLLKALGKAEDAPSAPAPIDEAAMTAALTALTNAVLRDTAAAESVALEDRDAKAVMVGKIVAARVAAQQARA